MKTIKILAVAAFALFPIEMSFSAICFVSLARGTVVLVRSRMMSSRVRLRRSASRWSFPLLSLR